MTNICFSPVENIKINKCFVLNLLNLTNTVLSHPFLGPKLFWTRTKILVQMKIFWTWVKKQNSKKLFWANQKKLDCGKTVWTWTKKKKITGEKSYLVWSKIVLTRPNNYLGLVILDLYIAMGHRFKHCLKYLKLFGPWTHKRTGHLLFEEFFRM